MLHPERYRDCSVLVLGLARSGVAVAQLFHKAGAKVIVNDMKERSLCPEAEPLEALGISVVCGSHPLELISQEVRLLVKNPGIPYSNPLVAKAISLGIEVVTEIEVASHIASSPLIGITGSNGKTTTTTLVHLMLLEAGMGAILAGNIGRALTEAVQSVHANEWLVTELSSFQLKGTVDFHPRIACLLNLYETHLDYHGTLSDYESSKARLFHNQTAEDFAVINLDDAYCQRIMPSLQANLFPFSAKRQLSRGVFIRNQHIVCTDPHQDYTTTSPLRDVISVADVLLRGAHNIENALAAVAIALLAGADLQSIRQVLSTFRGVEHRLEFVREHDGVVYYNDSKATNAVATVKSIEAFHGQPIVLICGGLDRGSDFHELLPILRNHVKAVVTLGETREKLLEVAAQAGIRKRKSVETEHANICIQQAVEAAKTLASQGDVVLLSTACASWDMFPSYEVRGSMFKHSVHTL
jgi:UDP-N-acetylmuramoylalanine--D-glutamate ligase